MSAVMVTMLPVHEIRLMLTHEHSLHISEDSLYPFFPIRPGTPHFLNTSLVRHLSLLLVCPTHSRGHRVAPIPKSHLLKSMVAWPPWLLYYY